MADIKDIATRLRTLASNLNDRDEDYQDPIAANIEWIADELDPQPKPEQVKTKSLIHRLGKINSALQGELTEANNVIATLERANKDAARQYADVREWNQILTEQLLHRETQIVGIKQALGKDAAQEHPGLTAMRAQMQATLNQEDTNE